MSNVIFLSLFGSFFFNDTATTEIYTLSLHDALPICPTRRSPVLGLTATTEGVRRLPSAFSSTLGSPASRIAVTEFVVPRSIPSTLAIVGMPPYRSGHHHLGWPKKLLSKSVARSQHAVDVLVRCPRLFLVHDCLMY